MTDKIEIPEEVKLIVKDYYEYKQKESTINNVGPVYEFLNDIIQKQDNEIQVGDWYYYKDHVSIDFYKYDGISETAELNDHLRKYVLNDNKNFKKVPKELIAGLEKLRNG